MFCQNCGKEMKETEKFCQNCGAQNTRINAEKVIDRSIPIQNPGAKKTTSPKKTRRWVIGGIVAAFLALGILAAINDYKYISIVKEGSMNAYPDIIVGEVFENFFADPEWSYTDLRGKSAKGIEGTVTFEGECLVYDEMASVTMWFHVDEESNTFELSGGVIEGDPEGVEIEDVLAKAYSEYVNLE